MSNKMPILEGPVPLIFTFNFLSSSQLHREMRDTLKGSHTGFRLFLITCRDKSISLYKLKKKKRQIIIPWGGTAYFSSVYKLFCSIIIGPVNLQEWIWLAEEILQSHKNVNTVQAFKGEHQALDNIYECNLLYYIDAFPAIRTWVRIKDLSFFTHPIAICYLISRRSIILESCP